MYMKSTLYFVYKNALIHHINKINLILNILKLNCQDRFENKVRKQFRFKT